MNKALLVDTNILIYAIDSDSIFHEKALNLILSSEYKLYTTSKNISEFLVVLTREEYIKIEVTEVLKILNNLLLNFEILYPNKDTSHKLEGLLKKYKPRGLKIHDFEIISIGLTYGVDRIATQNTSDFKIIKEISIQNL